jgi:type IV pilus assembly protein PilC
MFLRFQMKLPPMTAFTLKLSDFMQAYIVIIVLIHLLPLIFLWRMYHHPKGRVIFDKYLMKIPYVGDLIHRTVIEIFCRVFYALYNNSSESISPIKIAAESTGNRYFEERVNTIALPMMRNKGVGITEALCESEVFTDTALSKFKGGEETGNIKNAMQQLANYYESDTVYRLKNLIEWIQIGIAVIITFVLIGLTLVSAETAIITPKKPGVLDKTKQSELFFENYGNNGMKA